MTHLCIVRHGQTSWNLEGRWQGHADPSLNATGLEQARQLAACLAAVEFDAIYSSDLQRARITAEAVAAPRAMAVRIKQGLREVNLGAWEGKLVAEIPALYPQAWAERERDPLHSRPPGGESVEQLAARMRATLAEICHAHAPDARVLVISHGFAVAVFLSDVNGWPLDRALERVPQNATPVFLEWAPG